MPVHQGFRRISREKRPAHKAAVAFKQTCLDLLTSLSAQLPVADPPALARKLALLVEGAIVLAFIHRKPDPASDAREAAKLLVQTSMEC